MKQTTLFKIKEEKRELTRREKQCKLMRESIEKNTTREADQISPEELR